MIRAAVLHKVHNYGAHTTDLYSRRSVTDSAHSKRMDNGFDYPNDLCIQNVLWHRLDAKKYYRLEIRMCLD